jgi:hypothetical protein
VAPLRNLADARSALDLQEEKLRARAGFYQTYARNLEAGRARQSEDDVWARLARPAEPWAGPAVVASSYRMAAQYAALFDPLLAAVLMMRASRAYLDAGAAFGLFLAAGSLSDDALLAAGLDRELSSLSTRSRDRNATLATDPVQQAYLLLAVAARPALRERFPGDLSALLSQLAVYGLEPVGSGVPLEQYLGIAGVLLEYEPTVGPHPSRSFVDEIAPRLAVISRAHADVLHTSQRNRYLWQNEAAALDIVDLGQTALFNLVAGRGPLRSEPVLDRVGELTRDDPFAQLTVLIAQETARAVPFMTERAVRILGRQDNQQES